MKGQKARSGVAINGFEGGQMPLYRRLPKRGFKNPFTKDYNEVSLTRLQAAIDANKLDAGKPVDSDALVAAGIIRRAKRDGVKVIGGNAEIKTKLNLVVAGASKSVIERIEKAGGSVKLPEPAAAE